MTQRKTPADELARDSQRDTIDWSAHPSSSESVRGSVSLALDRQTISFGPGVEDFNRKPIESAPASESREIPRADVFKTPPQPDMTAQQFIANLTDEGKGMLEIILTMEDIMDGGALLELEKKRNKRGFVTLALHVVERRNADPLDSNQLIMVLKQSKPVRRI